MKIPIKKKERNLRVLRIFFFNFDYFIDFVAYKIPNEFNVLLYRQPEMPLQNISDV
jgi:hypothetical protein